MKLKLVNWRHNIIIFLAFMILGAAVHAAKQQTLILVDKKNNEMHVAHYDLNSGNYIVQKKHPVTLGKVIGDKEEESDLKTPEGIYFFTARLRPPVIKQKFGSLALYVNYPNAFDKLAGRTGYDIMLHATNEPDRLSKKFDSEGCIVVSNAIIEEINGQVELQRTPLLVFDELRPEYLDPSKNGELKETFQSWVQAWGEKNNDAYIDFYHSEFTAQGMDKNAWKRYKAGLSKKYATIDVRGLEPRFFRHPKYSVVIFEQVYHSKDSKGRTLHRSNGTKFLYVAKEQGKFKIIDERFTRSLLPPENLNLN